MSFALPMILSICDNTQYSFITPLNLFILSTTIPEITETKDEAYHYSVAMIVELFVCFIKWLRMLCVCSL